MTLRIGVPREVKSGETRVAMTPEGVREAVAAGARVAVESGAGTMAGHEDGEYAAAGADVVAGPATAWDADLVVKVKEPAPEERRFLNDRTALFAYLHLAAVPDLAEELLARRVTAIAYETVGEGGRLPLLRPMSEVAGTLAFQVGARGLERLNGGRGILLSGVGGTAPGRVCVVGAGTAGRCAAGIAAAVGAAVTVLDVAPEKLAPLHEALGDRVRTRLSSPAALAEAAVEADLVVSTVLAVGERAPILISRELLRRMKRGAVVVDIAIDQGGTLETSRPTTHASPFYVEEGIVHYCVANMPAAVPRTSTDALAAATLPYILRMIRMGVVGALRADPAFRAGLNTHAGRVTCAGAARSLEKPYVPADSVL